MNLMELGASAAARDELLGRSEGSILFWSSSRLTGRKTHGASTRLPSAMIRRCEGDIAISQVKPASNLVYQP